VTIPPARGPSEHASAIMLCGEDEALVEGLLARNRRSLAKAITLVESSRADHRERAAQLLNALMPSTGQSLRIGVSGAPGVGKSTFVDTLGIHAIGLGHRVAVLAIDPSSALSGGSILGDKTRMPRLSNHPNAFVRPSPSTGTLGGVASHTRESMFVCEAAGFDLTIVETVGVGQSETAVAGMTDLFLLMQLPNAGDELQAMKKGVMELADIIVVNKVDLDPKGAEAAAHQLRGALSLIRPASDRWSVPVITLSALAHTGFDALWSSIEGFRNNMTACGELSAKRRRQALAWMWQMIDDGLRARFRDHPRVQAVLPQVASEVASGKLAATAASARLLALLEGGER
jgi:LAO/AO transport system kinase